MTFLDIHSGQLLLAKITLWVYFTVGAADNLHFFTDLLFFFHSYQPVQVSKSSCVHFTKGQSPAAAVEASARIDLFLSPHVNSKATGNTVVPSVCM